ALRRAENDGVGLQDRSTGEQRAVLEQLGSQADSSVGTRPAALSAGSRLFSQVLLPPGKEHGKPLRLAHSRDEKPPPGCRVPPPTGPRTNSARAQTIKTKTKSRMKKFGEEDR